MGLSPNEGNEVALGEGGVGTLAFGSKEDAGDAGVSAFAPGQKDPEDYFTRTALDESLFKIVEKRYQAKSRDWIKP